MNSFAALSRKLFHDKKVLVSAKTDVRYLKQYYEQAHKCILNSD